jgi:inner membrane protein YidH
VTEPPPREEQPTDPRFLLANERTLLAWLRTSLAFVATGLALVALRHVRFSSDWVMVAAAASCVIGVLTAIWAYLHWRSIDTAIRQARPLPGPSIGPVLVVGIVVLASTGIIAIATML